MMIFICELPVSSAYSHATDVHRINQMLHDILCSPSSFKNMFVKMGAFVLLPWKRFLDKNFIQQTDVEHQNLSTKLWKKNFEHPTDFGALVALVGLSDMIVSVGKSAPDGLVRICDLHNAACKWQFSFALQTFIDAGQTANVGDKAHNKNNNTQQW